MALAALVAPHLSLAHGGEAGITVLPAQAEAGAEITVLGDALQPDSAARLHLVTAEGQRLVAEPTTDGVGHFSVTLALPADLAERVYELRLTGAAGESLSAYITVVGPGAAADTEAATGLGGSLVLAAVLALAGVGLLVMALRPASGHRSR